MIRFRDPPNLNAALAKIREIVGEPHAHDGQTFLFNKPMPDRHHKDFRDKYVELYRLHGYVGGASRGAYANPVTICFNPEGREVVLADGSRHRHAGGRWERNVDV
jgi:hypothetical protein